MPALRQVDPLWHEAGGALRGVSGHVLAIMGTMLDWAGQVTMGAAWRVGAAQSALGGLVTEGLYRVSRDPVFVDQLLLLLGVVLALPSVPIMVAALLFWVAAGPQIRSEKRHLETCLGESYRANQSRVARWRGAPGRGLI
nr:methyltransferase [Rubellimicrobium aerolatum]